MAFENFRSWRQIKMVNPLRFLRKAVAIAVLSLATLAHGQVTSVFGRDGVVIATNGDYTADQVVNAVDITKAYNDPNWLSSLAWRKISGAPIITPGPNNLGVGIGALVSNATGGANTAVGSGALQFDTSGGNNVAVGALALYSNAQGDSNTAVGHVALYFNTSGDANTAVGANALLQNTTGQSNTAAGYSAAQNVTTGVGNTAVGD